MSHEVSHPFEQHRVLHEHRCDDVVDDRLEGAHELGLVEGVRMLQMSDKRFASARSVVWHLRQLQALRQSVGDGLVLGRRSGIPCGGQSSKS